MQLRSQPAYVLHRRAFSESSQIVELFTRDHGRLAALAKGSRRGTHNRLRADPFQPWLVDLWGRGELPLLTGVEPAGCMPLPLLRGMASLAGMYINELLLALLQRDDPHPALFDHYGQCLARLPIKLSHPLRQFEWALLSELGYAPDLEFDQQGVPLDPAFCYSFSPQEGLLRHPTGPLHGVMLTALRDGTHAQLPAQRRFLREQLALHLDGQPLHSWDLLHALDQVLLRPLD